MLLLIPDSYIKTPKELRDKHLNGCGPKNFLAKLVPNKVLGVDFVPACNIHDWFYYIGNENTDVKKMGDEIFYLNLNKLVYYRLKGEKNVIKKFLKKRLLGFTSKMYYIAVAKLGKHAYNGEGTVDVHDLIIKVYDYKKL